MARRLAAAETTIPSDYLTLEILESYVGGTPIREEYLIVDSGMLAGPGARSYKLT